MNSKTKQDELNLPYEHILISNSSDSIISHFKQKKSLSEIPKFRIAMLFKFPLFLILLILVKPISAETDTLVVSNGDVLVGEIKSLEHGVLIIETEYSDSDFQIEWDDVTEFYSKRNFIITLSEGKRYYGKINSDPSKNREVVIIEAEIEYSTNLNDVVYLDAVKKDFLSRLSILLDLGFSFTKANNFRQFSSRTNLGYLTEDWSTDLTFDAVRSAQDDVDETKRTDARVGFRFFLPDDWFLFASADFLQNDEQKLKLRTTPSAGIGNYFIHSNSLYFGGAVGTAWTNEEYNDSAQTHRSSAEGVAGLELNLFNMGDLSLLTNFSVYPSFTESGRVRADFKFDLKYDLPLDFYIRLGYTLNYDNKPVEDAAESDYVLQTSFGWEL
jgi:putative salt-induced outer membrane protein YdiY